jgi:hypothetical protein
MSDSIREALDALRRRQEGQHNALVAVSFCLLVSMIGNVLLVLIR